MEFSQSIFFLTNWFLFINLFRLTARRAIFLSFTELYNSQTAKIRSPKSEYFAQISATEYRLSTGGRVKVISPMKVATKLAVLRYLITKLRIILSSPEVRFIISTNTLGPVESALYHRVLVHLKKRVLCNNTTLTIPIFVHVNLAN